jgi:hypothetical protein
MSPNFMVGCAVAIAAAILPGLTLAHPSRVAAAPKQEPPAGHLVFVVEGSVRNLHITQAVAKPDPWAGVPKGLTSEFALVALDNKGNEVARVPIDLSRFETDPNKVGAADVVNGCEIRSPRIGVLVNVPAVAEVARFVIVRGKVGIGEATAAAIEELLRGHR